jgi:hypothetical protein
MNNNIVDRIAKAAEKERAKIAIAGERSRKYNKWIIMFICIFLIVLGIVAMIYDIRIVKDYAKVIVFLGTMVFIITGIIL